MSLSNAMKAAALDHLIWPIIEAEKVRTNGPTIFASGKGLRVTMADGSEYIDMVSGFTRASSLGYGNAEVAEAVHEQLLTMHYAGTVDRVTPPMVALAEKVAAISPGGKLTHSFFVSGGSEAVESALRIARQYQQANGKPAAHKIITRWNAYHGATAGAMSLTNHLPVKDAPDPRVPGVVRTLNPMNYRNHFGMPEAEYMELCVAHLEETIRHENPETVAAFIGEAVMQSNGVQIPHRSYWKKVREICDRYGVVLIMDEVICGFGRTGGWFASDHFEVEPDIMTVAKAMTAGYMPMGAALMTTKIAESIDLFRHVHTYSGHAACAAAANAVISIKERDGLIARSPALSDSFRAMMREAFGDHPSVGEIRGLGNWSAIDFTSDRRTHAAPDPAFVTAVVARMKAAGYLLAAAGTSLEIAPPLIAEEEDYRALTAALKAAVVEEAA